MAQTDMIEAGNIDYDFRIIKGSGVNPRVNSECGFRIRKDKK